MAPNRRITAAAAFGLALAALYVCAAGTDAGVDLDNAGVRYYLFKHDEQRDAAKVLAHLSGIAVVVPAMLALFAFACWRHGRRPAIAAGVLIIGSVVSARLAKTLLGELQPLGSEWPRYFGPGYFPSGHGAGVMALVLAAILLAGSGRVRAAIAVVGGAVAGIVGLAHVVGLSHHPTDLLGGYLLAGIWALGASIYLQRDDPDDRSPAARRGARTALLTAVAVTIAGAVAIAQGVAVPAAVGTFGVPVSALAITGLITLLTPIRRGPTPAATSLDVDG